MNAKRSSVDVERSSVEVKRRSVEVERGSVEAQLDKVESEEMVTPENKAHEQCTCVKANPTDAEIQEMVDLILGFPCQPYIWRERFIKFMCKVGRTGYFPGDERMFFNGNFL